MSEQVSREFDAADAVDVLDAAVLDRTLDEDWSRYTNPASDVRARGVRIRRVRRFRSLLGAAGVLAVTVVVVAFAPGGGAPHAAVSPAAGAPTPSASGLPTPPDPRGQPPQGLDQGTLLLMGDAPAVGDGVLNGQNWQVRVKVFSSWTDLASQLPDIVQRGATTPASASDGPVALFADYVNGQLGGVRVLALSDTVPIIPDGRGTTVDPWFSRELGVVSGQIATGVDRLRVTAGGRKAEYPAVSVGGYRFIAFPVTAAEPVTQIIAVDGGGKEIGSGSGRFIPNGVFDSAHPELNFGPSGKKG